MRDLDGATQALLDRGRIIRRDAILFDFAEGTYGFWWGEGRLVWNGLTFVGAGKLLEVDNISAGGDMPPELTVTLSAVPNSELSPDVLAAIEDYTYHLRPAVLYRFYFDPDTGGMIGALPDVLFRGQVDQIIQEDNPGGEFQLVATLVGRTVDLRKAGQLKRGLETQKRINGGAPDLFFEHVATTSTVVAKWGVGD